MLCVGIVLLICTIFFFLWMLSSAVQHDYEQREIATKMFIESLQDPGNTTKFEEAIKALDAGSVDTKVVARAVLTQAHQKARRE